MQDVGICQLCQQEKPLADSHIIPKFLYKSLKDEKRRMHSFEGGQSRSHKPIQDGIREKLLCRGRGSCEELIGKWEQYASQAMYYIQIEGSDYDDTRVVKGIEYTPFKLFQMSILWRASVSTKSALNIVMPGPHQARLRRMLLSSNPGEPHDFGCMMMIRKPLLAGCEQLIVSPDASRYQGHNVYTFIINGIIWQFWVSSHTAKLPQYFLTREGELPFVILPEGQYEQIILRATKGLLH